MYRELPDPMPFIAMPGAEQARDAVLYSLPRAARLAQLCRVTARRWLSGKILQDDGTVRRVPSVIGRPASRARRAGVTFHEMLALRLIKGLRMAGLEIRAIRRAGTMAVDPLGNPRLLITKRLLVDGAHAFLAADYAHRFYTDIDVPESERDPSALIGWQHVFADIVERVLFRYLDWEDGVAARWWPLGRDRFVVVDPLILSGAPHVAATQVSTRVVAAAVRAEGDNDAAFETVAQAYGISARQVREAVRFESEWMKRG
jgi:uncharacterized protein (DUF433 family)